MTAIYLVCGHESDYYGEHDEWIVCWYRTRHEAESRLAYLKTQLREWEAEDHASSVEARAEDSERGLAFMAANPQRDPWYAVRLYRESDEARTIQAALTETIKANAVRRREMLGDPCADRSSEYSVLEVQEGPPECGPGGSP